MTNKMKMKKMKFFPVLSDRWQRCIPILRKTTKTSENSRTLSRLSCARDCVLKKIVMLRKC